MANIRVFKHEGIYLSTFEPPSRDPVTISKVSTDDDKDANLFPTRLRPNKKGDRSKGHGYPICWSKRNYEWYPYLPAVFNFDYPIFRGMSTRPNIVHDTSGWKLKNEDIALWSTIETVMVKTAAVLQEGSLQPLEQVSPPPPWDYGYHRAHAQEKFARKSIMKSLNAFQRLLGYCHYSWASSQNAEFVKETLTTENWSITQAYGAIRVEVPSLHIIVKNLFATMEGMRSCSNFAGVAVDFTAGYDCGVINAMLRSGVPVYLSWAGLGANPYLNEKEFPQNHLLRPLFPNLELLAELENVPEPMETISSLSSNPTPSRLSLSLGAAFATTEKLYDHPMDYVRLRLPLIASALETSHDRQRMKDRAKSAGTFTNLGQAKYYTFDSCLCTNNQTMRQKELWFRTPLTRHDAMEHFEGANPRNLWFDCQFDEWNHSDLFDFNENVSNDSYLASDEIDEWEEFTALEDGEASNVWTASEDDGSIRDQSDLKAQQARFYPDLDIMSLVEALNDGLRADTTLLDLWLSEEEFAFARYGLKFTGMLENSEKSCKAVGLPGRHVDLAVVQLNTSITDQWNPVVISCCDLSPNYETESGEFPDWALNGDLKISASDDQVYVLTVCGGSRRWRILIKDPLTVLQIKREGWHIQGESLIPNLIRKGIPFEILYPTCQTGSSPYRHTGPVIHPPGKAPTLVDYLSYRLDIANFFKLHPHAHVAALCGGGILWRIAVDVLPIPNVHDLIRPFHLDFCEPRDIPDGRYWTPHLSDFEVETIVGIYKWSEPRQCLRKDSWWPNTSHWSGSGLDFGAWTPLNEWWFQKRKSSLAEGTEGVVSSQDWRGRIKFSRGAVKVFLRGMRSVAESLIATNS